MKLIFAGA